MNLVLEHTGTIKFVGRRELGLKRSLYKKKVSFIFALQFWLELSLECDFTAEQNKFSNEVAFQIQY